MKKGGARISILWLKKNKDADVRMGEGRFIFAITLAKGGSAECRPLSLCFPVMQVLVVRVPGDYRLRFEPEQDPARKAKLSLTPRPPHVLDVPMMVVSVKGVAAFVGYKQERVLRAIQNTVDLYMIPMEEILPEVPSMVKEPKYIQLVLMPAVLKALHLEQKVLDNAYAALLAQIGLVWTETDMEARALHDQQLLLFERNKGLVGA